MQNVTDLSFFRRLVAVRPCFVEPAHASHEDEESSVRAEAGTFQCRRNPPHTELPHVPDHSCGDRGGPWLSLCLPHHRPPLVHSHDLLPDQVLRGQGVQNVEARTENNPLPHLGYLPNNNTTSYIRH